MCPCEESTDEPTQSGISSTDRGRRRWGIQQPLRQGANVKSTWPGCEVMLGTCHCLQYHSHMFHTRIPGLSSPTTECILCGGDPPRGLSDETTSLGSWVQRWKGSQLQPFKSSYLDDFCSANNCRAATVWPNRENCKEELGTLQAIQQHLKPITRDCISSSSAFSGGPVTRSKRSHQWMSGVTMLVRWLCSSPASAMLVRWACKPRSSSASENAPLGKKGHVNQQAASFQRPPKRPAQVVWLSLDWARNAPYYLDKVRVREGAVGPSFLTDGHFQSSRIQRGAKKAKTKASDPIQRRIAKGNERPPDHQARRRSRKETHPFPSGAKRKGKSYWPARRKNAVDEDSQESPTAKTCSSYEKKPARIKKYQKNRDSF